MEQQFPSPKQDTVYGSQTVKIILYPFYYRHSLSALILNHRIFLQRFGKDGYLRQLLQLQNTFIHALSKTFPAVAVIFNSGSKAVKKVATTS